MSSILATRRRTLLTPLVAVALVATTLLAGATAMLDVAVGWERLALVLVGVVAVALAASPVVRHRRLSPPRLSERAAVATRPGAAPRREASAGVDPLAASLEDLLRRLEAERARSNAIVLRAQAAERGRVARDLEDEVNQALTGVVLRLDAMRMATPPELADELDEARRLARRAMDELLGLAAALESARPDRAGIGAEGESGVGAVTGTDAAAPAVERMLTAAAPR